MMGDGDSVTLLQFASSLLSGHFKSKSEASIHQFWPSDIMMKVFHLGTPRLEPI